MNIDKSLILDKLKAYLNIDKDADFAAYLGIKPNVLANWRKRNAINEKAITQRCDFVNLSWLLTGEGQMLKETNHINTNPMNEPKLLDHLISEINYLRKKLDSQEEERKELRTICDKLIQENRELMSQATISAMPKKKEAI